MALTIVVALDEALSAGKFRLSLTENLTQLHALAFTYGKRLADGGCSCERARAVLLLMAEELGLTGGALELKVGT